MSSERGRLEGERTRSGLSRRELLHAGLGAAGLGLLRLAGFGSSALRAAPFMSAAAGASAGLASASRAAAAAPALTGFPIFHLSHDMPSVMVDGLPFAEGWTGDDFPDGDFPFHVCENCFPRPPEPEEDVEVAVIGGGLSGLATAYALRDRNVVLLEMRDRMGGVAMGERWRGTSCSLGSAYFIVPDRGSELEALYKELGVWPGPAVAEGAMTVEIDGKFVPDLLEWGGFTEREREAVRRYAEAVAYFGRKYPEIPLPRKGADWIVELDHFTFRADVEKRVGGVLPQRLAEAIQAYCYSSFGVGWEEISAAAGWNFIAAEEFGRIVLPGGNAGLAAALWRKIHRVEVNEQRSILRAGHKVVDVRLDGDRVRVTWSDGRTFRSLRARHVVMANAKFVAKYMLPELPSLDREKFDAMHQAHTRAYAMVNLLMEQRTAKRFYDLFLLGDGDFPMDKIATENAVKVIDVLDGGYGAGGPSSGTALDGSTILTLYWPLPWPASRFSLITEDSWKNYSEILAPQVREILDFLGADRGSIHQIRMSRWGHSMPVATPGALVTGLPEKLRRPIEDRIWFVNQDNWLLPAVETCLLEALHFAPMIRERL